MNSEQQLDWDAIKKKALEQFKKGDSLYGRDGAFAPLLKQFLESALEEELKSHIKEENIDLKSNRKNGKQKKTIKSSSGELVIETSRDRNGTFEPAIVKKRETILADTLESKIIGLYG